MRRLGFILISLGIFVGVPLLSGWGGYRIAKRQMRDRPWAAPALVEHAVASRRQSETMAGAFALHRLSLDGIENCYYSPPDFSRITWNGRDIPTPFVGYAPAPGPLPSGHINAQQFRYDRDVPLRKTKGVCRVFVVGGSTAYGAGASSNAATVGGRLEALLNASAKGEGRPFEVVTAAASSWTSTHERILIENRLLDFEPDLVIALSGHNDAYWSAAGEDVGWFRSHQDEYHHLLLHSLLHCNFGESLPARIARPPVAEDVAVVRLMRNVRAAHAALAGYGSAYCFALQPTTASLRAPRTPREASSTRHNACLTKYLDKYRQALEDLSAPGFSFVDLTQIFDDLDPSQEVFIDGCHFGDRGNDLIAQALARHVAPFLPATSTSARIRTVVDIPR